MPDLVLDDWLEPGYSAVREAIAPQWRSPVGGGGFHVRRQWARPLYRFRLKAPLEPKAKSSQLAAVFSALQGDVPFLFSGLTWGDFSTQAIFLQFGTGFQADFLLPNRHVSQVTVYVGTRGVTGTPVPLATLNAVAGSCRLSSIPYNGSYVRATYRCQYRCVLHYEGDMSYSESYDYFDQFSWEGVVLQEIPY